MTIRKVYGQDQIRYLRCRCCQEEFSERKNTALWNSKVPEAKAVSVAEHLADGCSINSTARLVKVDPSTVRRLNRKVGRHGQQYHGQEVQNVAVTELQADEWHGFADSKQQSGWEAELMDPKSKFILAHVQEVRDGSLIRRLLEDGAARLRHPHEVALFTDGLPAYRTLFPEIFGYVYYPPPSILNVKPTRVRMRKMTSETMPKFRKTGVTTHKLQSWRHKTTSFFPYRCGKFAKPPLVKSTFRIADPPRQGTQGMSICGL